MPFSILLYVEMKRTCSWQYLDTRKGPCGSDIQTGRGAEAADGTQDSRADDGDARGPGSWRQDGRGRTVWRCCRGRWRSLSGEQEQVPVLVRSRGANLTRALQDLTKLNRHSKRPPGAIALGGLLFVSLASGGPGSGRGCRAGNRA